MSKKIKCIVIDDEPVAREILTSFIAKVPVLHKVTECSNAAEALEAINTHTIDLLFLDINMPEISGLSLAKSINKKCKIIFTTAYREYALDGFDLQAVDYLLKPISFDRFLQGVNSFLNISNQTLITKTKEISVNTKNDFIFVRANRKMVKINFDEIFYIESLSDYIKIHTTKEIIVTRETISNIETKLPSYRFVRSHRSYIIAISKIDSYTNEFIEINNKAIPISRSYKDLFLATITSKK